MVTVYEAPNANITVGTPCVFLAGGITGCEDWQADVISMIKKTDLDIVLYNPRRENFPIDDPNAAVEQITWEYQKLNESDAVLFWFSDKTLCPIVLYELGKMSMTQKPIFIGCAPDYQRKQDVIIQTNLLRPEVTVVDSVETLVSQVIEWYSTHVV